MVSSSVNSAGGASDPFAQQSGSAEGLSSSNSAKAQTASSSSRSEASPLGEIIASTAPVVRVDPNDSASMRAVSKLSLSFWMNLGKQGIRPFQGASDRASNEAVRPRQSSVQGQSRRRDKSEIELTVIGQQPPQDIDSTSGSAKAPPGKPATPPAKDLRAETTPLLVSNTLSCESTNNQDPRGKASCISNIADHTLRPLVRLVFGEPNCLRSSCLTNPEGNQCDLRQIYTGATSESKRTSSRLFSKDDDHKPLIELIHLQTRLDLLSKLGSKIVENEASHSKAPPEPSESIKRLKTALGLNTSLSLKTIHEDKKLENLENLESLGNLQSSLNRLTKNELKTLQAKCQLALPNDICTWLTLLSDSVSERGTQSDLNTPNQEILFEQVKSSYLEAAFAVLPVESGTLFQEYGNNEEFKFGAIETKLNEILGEYNPENLENLQTYLKSQLSPITHEFLQKTVDNVIKKQNTTFDRVKQTYESGVKYVADHMTRFIPRANIFISTRVALIVGMNILALNMLRLEIDGEDANLTKNQPKKELIDKSVSNIKNLLTNLTILGYCLDGLAETGLVFFEWANHMKLLEAVTHNEANFDCVARFRALNEDHRIKLPHINNKLIIGRMHSEAQEDNITGANRIAKRETDFFRGMTLVPVVFTIIASLMSHAYEYNNFNKNSP